VVLLFKVVMCIRGYQDMHNYKAMPGSMQIARRYETYLIH